MRLITERHTVQGIAAAWHRQFPDRQPGDWHDQIAHALQALDVQTATALDVEGIIGNAAWTTVVCDECTATVTAAVQFGGPPDGERPSATICVPCLARAWQMVTLAAGDGVAP